MRKWKKTKILQSRQNQCILLLFLLITVIHAIAWNSRVFADWYRLYVFPVLTGLPARLSGLFRGSVGEVLIGAGICLVILEIVLLPFFLIQRSRLYRYRFRNVRLVCWILLYIYGTETLHCYVLYHATTLEEQYFNQAAAYGAKDLVNAYVQVVTKANELSEKVKRTADGTAVYHGTLGQLYQDCVLAMRRQGKTYPYLAGYYPNPKPIHASYFMSQQYLLGIYFPFTMEANYNTVMYPVNLPATVCHEYSHLKGIILEDEANFFGFLACIESDDAYLQYSGYLSVLGYLSRQVQKSVPEEIRKTLPVANEQVRKDDIFLTQEQWEQVEKKAVFSTEAVNQATNAFLETNLTMNGITDGMQSYSRVVRLVVRYYGDIDTK